LSKLNTISKKLIKTIFQPVIYRKPGAFAPAWYSTQRMDWISLNRFRIFPLEEFQGSLDAKVKSLGVKVHDLVVRPVENARKDDKTVLKA